MTTPLQPQRFSRIGLLTTAIAIATLPLPAHAWRLNWFVELGIEHNDNVLLSETDRVTETIVRPALGFSLAQEGAVFQANVNGLLEYRNYLDDTYGSEFMGELEGTLNWVMVPERLHFTVQNRLTTLPITVAAPSSPDNRQITNIFAAGPTWYFRLSPTLRGQAELRWIDSYAEETEAFNSERWAGALRLTKALGATRQLSFNAQGQTVDVHAPEISDYERYDLFARYSQALNRVTMELDVGYSWFEPDFGASHSSPMARGMLAFNASERSTLSATVARRYSDTAEALLGEVGVSGAVPSLPPIVIVGGTAVTTSAVYQETSVQAGYAYAGTRAGFAVMPFYRELDYINDSGPDQTGRGVDVTWSWLLRPRWSLTGDLRLERLRFDATDLEHETRTASVWLRHDMTANWSGRLGYGRYERDSDAANLSANQNVWYLAVTYTR